MTVKSKSTHNLLDDLARGVEVDQTLVDLELVTVPGLRTLTARLDESIMEEYYCSYNEYDLPSYGS